MGGGKIVGKWLVFLLLMWPGIFSADNGSVVLRFELNVNSSYRCADRGVG